MKKNFTISAFTENHPGVLHRITAVFTRRKVNVESLTVCETETKGISRFTIVVATDQAQIEKIVKTLNRIIEVVEVFSSEDEQLIFKEIAFIRVEAGSPKKRAEIEEFSHRHGAEITYADSQSLVVEATGSEDSIQSLYLLLEPFGIQEFLRSGRIAMRKIENQLHSK